LTKKRDHRSSDRFENDPERLKSTCSWNVRALREKLLQAMAHGSAAAWGHLNLLGEYDFSEDKLQDSVGIKPPKLTS
jgi:hypothetical protein